MEGDRLHQGGLGMDGRMDEVWKVSPSDAHQVSLTQPRLVALSPHSLLILSPQEPFPALWGDRVP